MYGRIRGTSFPGLRDLVATLSSASAGRLRWASASVPSRGEAARWIREGSVMVRSMPNGVEGLKRVIGEAE
jgi:hypothetical protein